MQVGQHHKATAKCLQFFRGKMLKRLRETQKNPGKRFQGRKRRKNAEENTKTLQKLIKMRQPLSTVKLQPHGNKCGPARPSLLHTMQGALLPVFRHGSSPVSGIVSRICFQLCLGCCQLVAARVDYCNSLLYSQSKCILKRLQSVLNSAARLIYLTSKYEHVTPLLIQLHWLPIEQRITFKIAVITFNIAQNAIVFRDMYLQCSVFRCAE